MDCLEERGRVVADISVQWVAQSNPEIEVQNSLYSYIRQDWQSSTWTFSYSQRVSFICKFIVELSRESAADNHLAHSNQMAHFRNNLAALPMRIEDKFKLL